MSRFGVSRITALAVLALAFCTPAAFADFSNHVLDGNANSMTGFTGHQSFLTTAEGGYVLNIRVDYAVFAPGTYSSLGGVFNPFLGTSSANDYLYAYQIYNEGPLSGVTTAGTVELSELGIDVSGNVSGLGFDAGFDPSSQDVNATFARLFPDGVAFNFVAPFLLPDAFSTILLISSPDAPSLNFATVKDGGAGETHLLPSPAPVPAPSAAVLALVGLGLVIKRKWLGA